MAKPKKNHAVYISTLKTWHSLFICFDDFQCESFGFSSIILFFSTKTKKRKKCVDPKPKFFHFLFNIFFTIHQPIDLFCDFNILEKFNWTNISINFVCMNTYFLVCRMIWSLVWFCGDRLFVFLSLFLIFLGSGKLL